MNRARSAYECAECGAQAARWAGRCTTCGSWNTVVERPEAPVPGVPAARGRVGGRARAQAAADASIPVPLGEVDPAQSVPSATGIGELDRVLTGGLVPGSVTLIGGEPGIGKSTLVLQAVASLARRGARTLLVAAEESAEHVRRRAERLGAVVDGCYVVATTELVTALEAAGRLDPEVLVIDSIQTVGDAALGAQAGSASQVRECAAAFSHYAKATGTATVLVGHVTKDGSLAGPKTLEHLVDTVLSFEGDRHHGLRLLTAAKHRFGATGELGLFEMTEDGLVDLEDPSRLLLTDRRPDAAGSVIVPVVEGRRPLLVEIQALVTQPRGTAARRVVQGLPVNRCSLVLAVIERCLGIPTSAFNVFVSTVGGLKVTEPAADLAIALAIVSAFSGVPLAAGTVAFGEIGLAGDVRQTARSERRIAEARRLGFNDAVGPRCPGAVAAGAAAAGVVAAELEGAALVGAAAGATVDAPAVREVSTLREAVSLLGLMPVTTRRPAGGTRRPSSPNSSRAARGGAFLRTDRGFRPRESGYPGASPAAETSRTRPNFRVVRD